MTPVDSLYYLSLAFEPWVSLDPCQSQQPLGRIRTRDQNLGKGIDSMM
jgi:hypothetical protein